MIRLIKARLAQSQVGGHIRPVPDDYRTHSVAIYKHSGRLYIDQEPARTEPRLQHLPAAAVGGGTGPGDMEEALTAASAPPEPMAGRPSGNPRRVGSPGLLHDRFRGAGGVQLWRVDRTEHKGLLRRAGRVASGGHDRTHPRHSLSHWLTHLLRVGLRQGACRGADHGALRL